jgi:hypothetical protein
MTKLTVFLVCLLTFVGFATSANAARPDKSSIRHCGCVVYEDGSLEMRFIDVNVSRNARGHTKHGAGTIDSCFDGVDTMVDFLRTADDCHIAGPQLSGGGLTPCDADGDGQDEVMAGDVCGDVVE